MHVRKTTLASMSRLEAEKADREWMPKSEGMEHGGLSYVQTCEGGMSSWSPLRRTWWIFAVGSEKWGAVKRESHMRGSCE